MGFRAGLGRLLAAPLIIFNLICAIIILGLAGRVLDKQITGQPQGNGATLFLVLFSLIAGVVAIASYIAAAHHMRVWRSESGAASQAVSWIAWLLLIIAFCLAWKEIHIGGRNKKLKALEAFTIILTLTHLLYLLALHIEDHGESADGHGKYRNNKPLNPNAPAKDNNTPAATAV